MVDQGLAETRSQARALIMTGQVMADGYSVDKAGQGLDPQTSLTLKNREEVFASRGGLKLAGALDQFNMIVTGITALDVGASTGGFTDCLLKKGATRVVAVDVGHGLLDWRLRQDPRVRVLERINARFLTVDLVGADFDLAVIDVSFISLGLILPPVAGLVKAGGFILALVKPQFEVGRDKVGRGGVVRDPADQKGAVASVAQKAMALGLEVLGTVPACIKGPKGNQEYFLWLKRQE